MPASSTQLQFVAEFILFLAAATGLASIFLPGERTRSAAWAKAALGTGFLLLAGAAYLHGSLLLGSGRAGGVIAPRVLGAVALAVGAVGWGGAARSRRLVWAGTAALVGATGLYVVDRPVIGAMFLAAGGVCLGGGVILVSRRSIAARIAASAAVTLLIVVLVLSVALSGVLVTTIERGEMDRLEARAATQASQATNSFRDRLADAKVVAASLAADARSLVPLASGPPSGAVTAQLAQLSSRFLSDVSLAYVSRSGTVQGAVRLDDALVVSLAGSDVVRQSIEASDARGSVQLTGGRALAVGVQPVSAAVDGTPQLLGVAVAASPLDRTYLDLSAQDDRDLSLALVARTGPVADHGPRRLAGRGPEESLVRSAIDDGRASASTTGGRFVAVAPVRAADDQPLLALVASAPTTLVDDTRRSLFRSLFLIALGGTLLALVLASVVGKRIGAGLRRLRGAAEALGKGQLDVRAAVDSSDEVGVLAATFDSMAEAVQVKTASESHLRAHLEAVVAGMGEALVAADRGGRVTTFNEAAVELLGVPASEARGRPIHDVVRLVGANGSPLTLDARGAGSEGWRARASVERQDGSMIPAVVTGGALSGSEAGMVLVLRDLRAEQEVDRMKAEFISRAGHELRTPLTNIIGFSELLARPDVDPEQSRDCRSEVLAQSRSLVRIVEMLEFIASTDAGRVTLRPQPLSPRKLVEDVVQQWSDQADCRHVFGRRVARGTPPVMADQRWIAFCLHELVGNAVKFSPEGGKINVTAQPVDGLGAEFMVSDRGAGMSAQEQASAFGEFVQADTSDTRSYGGLGLGLALVRRVIEAHGGSVRCESTKGHGSTFSIILPAASRDGR